MSGLEPWQWPEGTWRATVGRARAGRSLKPAYGCTLLLNGG